MGFQVFFKALKRMRKVAIDVSIHCYYVSAQGARVNINLLWGASEVDLRTFCVCDLFSVTVVHQWSWCESVVEEKSERE